MGGAASTELSKQSTALDVILKYKPADAAASPDSKPDYLRGKWAIVTGGNSGIGLETCKALAYAGCNVIMGSRKVESGNEAIASMKADGSDYKLDDAAAALVSVIDLDLEDLDSIKAFAVKVLEKVGADTLDFVIFNAGRMAIDELEYTMNGWEKQIATNHFGHFYLYQLLKGKLEKQEKQSRVVVVASTAHRRGTIKVEDLHYKHGRTYEPFEAYGQSKAANILFAKHLADIAPEKIIPMSLHPGVILTNLATHIGWLQSFPMNMIFRTFIIDKTIQQGAATTIYACLHNKPLELRGQYLADCALCDNQTPEVLDTNKERRKALWEVTEQELNEALAK